MAVFIDNFTEELERFDAEFPNVSKKPIVNVVGIPHSGTRSVAQYMEWQGCHPRLMHLQAHYHTVGFVRKLIETEYCVLAMRDPLIVLLSTYARKDDSIESVFKNMDDLFSMPWPAEKFAVELDTRLPTVGGYGNYPAKLLYAAKKKIQTSQAAGAAWTALKNREPIYRPRLEAMGYTSLLWWT